MFFKRFLAYSTLVASQILGVCCLDHLGSTGGLNDTTSPEDVIDMDTPGPPLMPGPPLPPAPPLPPGPRMPFEWELCWGRGRQYFERWQQQSPDASTPLPPVNTQFDVHATLIILPTILVELLRSMGISNEGYRVEYSLMWPRNLESTTDSENPFLREDTADAAYTAGFSAVMSVEQGLYIVFESIRGHDYPGYECNLPYSEIAWYMWTMDVARVHDPEDGEVDYSVLDYYVRPDITDPQTLAIMEHVLSMPPRSSQKVYPTSFSRDNAFWPLLGSTVGIELIDMLTAQKGPMKGKGILYFEVRREPPEEESQSPPPEGESQSPPPEGESQSPPPEGESQSPPPTEESQSQPRMTYHLVAKLG